MTYTEAPSLKSANTNLTIVQQQPGLLVTNELNNAIGKCREKVQQISKDCRMKNRRFRDMEFDLENDKSRCLEYLFTNLKGYKPSDVRRVTQIFDKPRFYATQDFGKDNNTTHQGFPRDCWLVSALATISTCPRLVEKFCIEQDEEVGVYGFIFFKNNSWVDVIIDDLLYTSMPKYEELSRQEQELYHLDKEAYVNLARKGSKQLFFAKSGNDEETWVPLLEKAYAKLHGSYASVSGGLDCHEVIEDMTGGVSSLISVKDILDTDRFWREELLRAGKDRLFGCAFKRLSQDRGNLEGAPPLQLQGLFSGRTYSVIRAVESRGRRFVVVRNPWGKAEWNGRWSDGSKEWNGQWVNILPEIGHVFGDDGQFVMEYSDFLNVWDYINRTVLFDDNWIMSSQWLRVPMKPLPSPMHYGDVSFTFSLSGPSSAVIVLSRLDDRYYKAISGRTSWSLDFILVKAGTKHPLALSEHAWCFVARSVHLEIDLEPGDYIVYVRIDRYLVNKSNYIIEDDELRDLSRLLCEKAKSQSIASNLLKGFHDKFTPNEISQLIERDYVQYKTKSGEASMNTKIEERTDSEPGYAPAEEGNDSDEVVTTTTTTVVVTKKKKIRRAEEALPEANTKDLLSKDSLATLVRKESAQATEYIRTGKEDDPAPAAPPTISNNSTPQTIVNVETPTANQSKETNTPDYFTQDDNNLYLGLKVYTKKDVSVNIEARLRAPEFDVIHKDSSCTNL